MYMDVHFKLLLITSLLLAYFMGIKVSLLWQQLESKDGPLSVYNYELIFKFGHKHRNADSMSCLPFQSDDCEEF